VAAGPRLPSVTLNNDVEMPQIGLGLGNGLDPEQTAECVEAALEAGYRSFDTAARYRNEEGLGRALKRSGVPRAELFVATKLWNTDHGRESALRAFDASLKLLDLEYIDLHLIHFPVPVLGKYVETWLALEETQRDGRVRAIGVANFSDRHLANVLEAGSVVPVVNQIELHPRYQQRPARACHARHGIKTQAWSPLARRLLFDDPVLSSIADRYDATLVQLVLRWHLQLGNVVIPKTVTPARMRENLGSVNCPPLDDEDMVMISALDCGARTGPDPDVYLDGGVDWNEVRARWNRLVNEADARSGKE
jgi:2,5-diketo-D-gluconate reductase A